MANLNVSERIADRPGVSVARLLVVTLALATAAIHASLGGMLFLANAIGYTTFAVAMVVPGPLGRIRWLVRVALLGFTAVTIGGWLLFGARFPLAYVDKSIEVGLIAVTAFELWRSDGGPIGVARQARRLVGHLATGQVMRVGR